MDPLVERLGRSVRAVRAAIAEACERAGRAPDSVELCAISKYATAVETRALVAALAGAGVPVLLGESRVQALCQKAGELAGSPDPIRWDLVGNLQRNKAAHALRYAARIHALDRDAILDQLEALGARDGRIVRGFLQVNISGEPEKHGYPPNRLAAAVAKAEALPHVRIEGLMGMAPRGTDDDSARPAFAKLRELRDRHASDLEHLSMGMSGDYRGAILEGATIVRIGSALFAG